MQTHDTGADADFKVAIRTANQTKQLSMRAPKVRAQIFHNILQIIFMFWAIHHVYENGSTMRRKFFSLF